MDFYNGKDLLKKCQEMNAPISDIMKLRETTTGSLTIDEVDEKISQFIEQENIQKIAQVKRFLSFFCLFAVARYASTGVSPRSRRAA